MRALHVVLTATLIAGWALLDVNAEETPVTSRIVSVGLFKNGLAVVRRELTLPAQGTFLLADVPEPVHGTWWLQSDVPVDVTVTEREVDGPASLTSAADLQKALEGRSVTICFRESQLPPVTGKVEKLDSGKEDKVWNRRYEASNPYYYNRFAQAEYINPAAAQPSRFLILQTETGRVFVDAGMIAYFKADGKEALPPAKRKAPVMLFQAAKATKAVISYLTKGIAWAPSYQIDTTDPKTLSIEQTAVIKNELADLENVEIQLISGFPSMRFSHVTSPLSLRTNWAAFFQAINERIPSSAHDNSGMTQQRLLANNRSDSNAGLDLSATPAGEGVDLHYQSIGARTLKLGEVLSISVAKAKAGYERVVEWSIPDLRNENGRAIDEYQRRDNPEKYEESLWDSLRFRNPFAFPMTTGVASIAANGQFCGQQMAFWANAGEEASIKITQSLGVRSRSTEREEPGERENVKLGSTKYWKATIAGDLTVNNHRKEKVKLIIRRRFSGDLTSADGEPKKQLLEEGVYSVNPRNELVWTLTLKPGEEKVLAYRYSVLVSN